MSKKGTRNPTITRNESSVSNESTETVATSSSQNQEAKNSDGSVNIQTKAYIDTVLQTITAAIMRSMQQMMDQQLETQRQWNLQCIERSTKGLRSLNK
ncbi:hypothetical protein F8M41_012065 [Gigaspora margarita]|uniref:Uncharacterized protein n=1 Tax=Gigaspora margarita TaxID=4874 RepID=A0A8H3X1K0_GIGMA|nr:hypothetical protein F8M41_012065 [Gigaspora margarita]